MKEIILLLLTFAILAVQYHLGLMRKPGFGAVLPAALAALFLAVSFLEQTTEYGITGLLCVLAVAAAWGAGRLKAGKHEKAQLDQMKAKTYEKSRADALLFSACQKPLSRRIRPSYCWGARGGGSPPRMGSNALNALHGKAFSEHSEDFSAAVRRESNGIFAGRPPCFS